MKFMLPAHFFFGGCKVFPLGMLHDGPRLFFPVCLSIHPCCSSIKALPDYCGGAVLKHLFEYNSFKAKRFLMYDVRHTTWLSICNYWWNCKKQQASKRLNAHSLIV